MSLNSFICPKCGRRTKHIKLGNVEGSAQRGDNGLLRTVGTLFEISGVFKAYSAVTGDHFWKCCDCGLVHTRNAKGEISDENVFRLKPKNISW